MTTEQWRQLLAAADARIARGEAERTAGADQRAQVIAAEVARRGRGGQSEVAAELGVSDNTISKLVARARTTGESIRQLPADTFERLLAAELANLAPLSARQWQAVAYVVRGLVIDESWIEQAPLILADEIGDAEDLQDSGIDTAELVAVCRNWSRAQTLAVIDTCQKGDLTVLPHQSNAERFPQ